MTKAIRIHAHGGPEVMQWEDVPTPEPGPGEALVRHEAVGLNYIDVYFRTGLYKAPTMPVTLGHGRRRHRRRGRARGHRRGGRATASPMPAARSAPTRPSG